MSRNITAPDDLTVVFKLKGDLRPANPACSRPAHCRWCAASMKAPTSIQPANNTSVGTGPSASSADGSGLARRLGQNPDYYYGTLHHDGSIGTRDLRTPPPTRSPSRPARSTSARRLGRELRRHASPDQNACICGWLGVLRAPRAWQWFNHRQGVTADVRFRKAVSARSTQVRRALWNGMGKERPDPSPPALRDESALVRSTTTIREPRLCSRGKTG